MMGPGLRKRPFDEVSCVVCSTTLRVGDAREIDQPPLCSPDCADKWQNGMEARDA